MSPRRRPRHDIPRPRLNAKQRLGVWVARLFSLLTRLTPLPIGYVLADRIGDLLYWRSRRYRLNVIDNLRHVQRGQVSELQLRRQARHVFRTSSRNFWDLGRLPHVSQQELVATTQLPKNGWSLLDRIRAEGRGGIVVTGHIGAFDFISQMLFILGYDPYVLTSPTVGEFVYAAVNHLRLSRGAPLEDISSAAIRRMLRVLRQGGFVGAVADYDFTDAGAPILFFGQETTLPSGPIRIARATGAPIVAVFALRQDDGGNTQRYAFHIEDPFTVPKTDDEDADVQHGLAQLTALYERYLQLAPQQWVMFQRVWPEQPRQRLAWRLRERRGERRETRDDLPQAISQTPDA